MKTSSLLFILLSVAAAPAAVRESASHTLLAEAMLPGRPRLDSAHCAADTACSPAGGTAASAHFSARFGYAGQLYDITGGTLSATPSPVPETSAAQLSLTATLDDGTALSAMQLPRVGWEVLSGPVASITPAGLATTVAVRSDSAALIRATVAGTAIEGSIPVRDTIPDNFGPVAGDGVPDAWQFDHFDTDKDGKLDLPAGPADDPDSDGANNLAEWIAGTGPVDAADILRMEPLGMKGDEFQFRFGPVFARRTYIVLTSMDLETPPEKALTVTPTADAKWFEASVRASGNPRSFFRLSVEVK